MASSGIEVDGDVKEAYREMKLKKKYKMLMMGLNEKKTKVVLVDDDDNKKESSNEFEHKDFVALVTKYENDCRYFVYEYNNKLILIKWAPDTAPAAKKMIFASTFDAVKRALEGVRTLEATDADDLTDKKLKEAKSG